MIKIPKLRRTLLSKSISCPSASAQHQLSISISCPSASVVHQPQLSFSISCPSASAQHQLSIIISCPSASVVHQPQLSKRVVHQHQLSISCPSASVVQEQYPGTIIHAPFMQHHHHHLGFGLGVAGIIHNPNSITVITNNHFN